MGQMTAQRQSEFPTTTCGSIESGQMEELSKEISQSTQRAELGDSEKYDSMK